MKNETWNPLKDLSRPLHWRKPRRVRVCMDFADREGTAAAFGVMAARSVHVYEVLAKDIAEALAWFTWAGALKAYRTTGGFPTCILDAWQKSVLGLICPVAHLDTSSWSWPLPNVIVGVEVQDQATADERIPLLLQCPAAIRWVSAEPLLGAVDLGRVFIPDVASVLHNESWEGEREQFRGVPGRLDPLIPKVWPEGAAPERWLGGVNFVDWVVAGGESGPGARPMHPDWVRSLRDQCVAAGVPFALEGWGAWLPQDHAHVLDDDTQVEILTGCGPAAVQVCATPPVGPVMTCYKVGKSRAGRLLDGRAWDQKPEAPHV